MSGRSNHHLPNNNNSDEGRIINDDSTNNNCESCESCESNKRQRVTTVGEEEDEVEQIAERLHNVQRRCPTETNVLLGDALQRWYEDAASVTEELKRFILRNEPQQLPQREEFVNVEQQNDNVDEEDDDENKSWMWKIRLDFFELCFSLKCNHQNNIHKVEIINPNYDDDVFPDGYVRYLGNSVLRNPYITEIVLESDCLRADFGDYTRAVAVVLEYIRTSTTLRKVAFTDCLNYTTDINKPNCQFVASILDAITVNASIEDLSIVSVYPVDAFDRLMSTSTTLKTLHIDCSDFDVIANHDHRNQLLRSMGRNRSIENLSLSVPRNQGWIWVEEIPRRMASGTAKVRKLKLEGCRELPRVFFEFIETTTSLQTLEMNCHFLFGCTRKLQLALARNKSIENLKLIGEYNDGIMGAILYHLHNGPSTLRKLALKSCFEDPFVNFDAVREYLCHSTTAAMLENLELEDCNMIIERMADLVKGLQVLDSRPSADAIQLTLKSCLFGEEEMHELVEFIAARSNYRTNQQEVSTPWFWYDEDPKLVAAMKFPPEVKIDENNDVNGIGVSLSTTVLSSPASSSSSSSSVISSRAYHSGSIQFVSISTLPYGDAPAYCDALMATVESSSIVCLQLSHLGPRDIAKLARCLSRLTSLCALHLINIQDDVVPATIMKGLQQNRSLLTTSFLREGRQPFFENRHDRKIAQAYCQRNHFLSNMIFRKNLFSNVSSVAVELMGQDDSCTNHNRLVLLPKLFRVAVSIPLMKSQFLLAALLEMDVTIGPRDGQDSL